MELRDIEIFLTLAELLHFGRTAERLHVSVARVSQAIKKQERGIGTALFHRDSRNVRLTLAGEQLRRDLAPIYQGLKDSMDRARLAAQGKTDVLRIGTFGANAQDLRYVWESFRARHPQFGLQVRFRNFLRPFDSLHSGELDILVSWLPVEEPGLTVGPVLFTEPRVLAVAHDHELAGRGPVSVEVLADRGVSGGAEAVPDYWENSFTPFSTPTGRKVERLVDVAIVEDMFGVVASGEAVQLLAAHASRYHIRPDIAYLPIPDAPRLHWALVWRSEGEREAIRALARLVRDLGPTEL
ncbi:LysR family transcriptional regulator [Nonomuraea sp. NPDC049152]|uniref:LysR family transcriptional regulator n=1 Tax=Nonomuraea sp. NPDC049152 TaxID=3154350 RepID=UPI0033D19425